MEVGEEGDGERLRGLLMLLSAGPSPGQGTLLAVGCPGAWLLPIDLGWRLPAFLPRASVLADRRRGRRCGHTWTLLSLCGAACSLAVSRDETGTARAEKMGNQTRDEKSPVPYPDNSSH